MVCRCPSVNPKTLNSVNAGLPITRSDTSFKENYIISMEKVVCLVFKQTAKMFLHWIVTDYKYGVKTLFLLFNIKEKEKYKVLSPIDQANSVVLQYTHHIQMACLITGGRLSKC